MRREELYRKGYYGRTSNYYDDIHNRVLEIFSYYSNKINKFLDIGCGDGNFSLLLKESCHAREVYGIEISKSYELAKDKLDKVLQLDASSDDFPFENNFFDAIYAGSVIEYIYDTDHFLSEVYRVLRNGGIFVLTFPNLASIYNRIALLFGFQPYATSVSLKYRVGHIKLINKNTHYPTSTPRIITPITLRGLIELLHYYNFKIIYSTGATSISKAMTSNNVLYRIFSLIDKIISHFPSISHNVIIIAKK